MRLPRRPFCILGLASCWLGGAACQSSLQVKTIKKRADGSGALSTAATVAGPEAPQPAPAADSAKPAPAANASPAAPVARLAAPPGGVVELGTFSASVVGDPALAEYRLAVVKGASCTGAAYSAWRAVAEPVALTLDTAGQTTLCLLGESVSGAIQASPTAYTFVILSAFDLTPTVQTLSETAVVLTWTPPAGAVDHFEIYLSGAKEQEPGPLASIAMKNIGSAETTATVDGLPAGSVGRAVVRAKLVALQGVGQAAPSAPYATPVGTINSANVSSFDWLTGHLDGNYAEGVFVSAAFSMFYGNAYDPEMTGVYRGVPVFGDRPLFNWGSRWLAYTDGFQRRQADCAQIWSDGVGKVVTLEASFSHRVLVFNHLPDAPDKATPDLILGQTTMTGTAADAGLGSVSAIGVHNPSGVCFDGATLYVSDTLNNRVLGWHGWPTRTGQPADFVLGQALLTTNDANHGGLSAASLANPNGLACLGGMLAVADGANHRVLIWDTAPTSSGVPATRVIGQSGFAAGSALGAGGVGAGGMGAPAGLALADNGQGGTALIVSDFDDSRVLQWDTLPATGAPFSRVYGQPDRTTTTANTGGQSAHSLARPYSLTVDHQGKLWVADFDNARFVRYDFRPVGAVANGPDAIGYHFQRGGSAPYEYLGGSFSPTRFGNHSRATGSLDAASGLFSPSGGRFYNVAPTDSVTPATVAYGQVDLSHSVIGGPTTATSIGNASYTMGFTSPVKIGGRVYWSDNDNSRIVSKPGLFTPAQDPPDVILGNLNFDGTQASLAHDDWSYKVIPSHLATDGTRLFAVDGPRIAVWDPAPTASNVPMSYAIGAPDALTRPVVPAVTAATLGPGFTNTIVLSGGKLIVADLSNNRVLIWNAVPAASGVAADVVLGQSGFTANAAGDGSSRAGMSGPAGVAVLGGKLIVSDRGNGRLLIWNSVPTASGTPADAEWLAREHRYSLPAYFNDAMLAPGYIQSFGGRLYVEQADRYLILADQF